MAPRGSKPPGKKAPPEIKVIDYSGDVAVNGSGPLHWWNREQAPEEDDVGRAMVSTAKNIEASPAEQMRYDLNLLYGSLYEGRELSNLYQYGGQATAALGTALANGSSAVGQITWNVIRSVVQTVASQVSRSRPRARFVTSGGTFKQKRRAKKLTTFVDGLFAEAKVYDKTQQGFICAGAFDVAGIHVFRKGDRVAVELVRCNEIMVGANDGIDGRHRSMYRRKFIDKGVLLAEFGKGKGNEAKAEAISHATCANPVGDGVTNLVEVYEAWHLPSSDDSEDGWHVIAIDSTAGGGGGTLLVEEYKKKYFPIILFSLDPALAGPYGISAAATLLPIQIEVNMGLDKIRKGQHLACRPGVWLPFTAKLNKGQISSAVGQVNYYAGNKEPTFYSPTAFSPEVYQHLERHFEKGFSLYGVNTQVAAGTKEAGTTSAVAIRESLDVQTARYAVLAQRWEALHMEIARIGIDTAREHLRDMQGPMRVSAPGTVAARFDPLGRCRSRGRRLRHPGLSDVASAHDATGAHRPRERARVDRHLVSEARRSGARRPRHRIGHVGRARRREGGRADVRAHGARRRV
jgi:hypothetical protein